MHYTIDDWAADAITKIERPYEEDIYLRNLRNFFQLKKFISIHLLQFGGKTKN